MPPAPRLPSIRVDAEGFISHAPGLNDGEAIELMLHLLRIPHLRATAVDSIHPTMFHPTRQAELVVLFESIATVCVGEEPLSFQALRSEIDRRGEIPNVLVDVEREWLMNPSTGFLARAQRIPAGDLSKERGLELLGRFIIQKGIAERFRFALNSCLEGYYPAALKEYCEQGLECFARVDQFNTGSDIVPVGEELAEHDQRLRQVRGRELVGLRTGLRSLDDKLLGLRGLTVLAAGPGVGKTAFALQIARGVCRHHAENNAAVLFVSLDMSRFEVITRLECQLADMEWATFVRGSPSQRGTDEPFTPAHAQCLEDGRRRLVEEELDRRLTICDRQQLRTVTARSIATLIREAKDRCGATRALAIIDYLNLIEPASDSRRHDHLEADKARVKIVQDVIALTRTAANPEGDAILAISEARKPAAKQAWGAELADVMGSARIPYAADAVLVFRRMLDKDIASFYALEGAGRLAAVAARRARLEAGGIAPIVLDVAKGRDGMTRGEIGLEFHFRRSRLDEIQKAPGTSSTLGPRSGSQRERQQP